MANTSVGWQAESIKWIVREVAGSRGAAGGQRLVFILCGTALYWTVPKKIF
jgi:hypothetical protein